jgi:hypothetical protein
VQAPEDGVAEAPAWIYDAASPARLSTEPGADIPEGERNATLTRLAGAMRHHGMTAPEIELSLLAVNAARCRPPLPDEDVRTVASSVGRYAPAERGPRIVPGKASAPSDLDAVRLADIEAREPGELRHGRWDPADHSVLFGDGGAGKGVLVAYDVARLSREGEVVLLLDYERHAELEWRPRVETFGGDLERVYVVHPDDAIWHVADEIIRLIDALDVTWVIVDSVAYACLGAEVEKSVTATRYSAAIGKLPAPVISLAHTTKAEADPKHPFGSVFWSNGARITIGMSVLDDGTRILKNRKTNQRAPFHAIELDWSWSEEGRLPLRLTERRAVVTLMDRAWDALASGAMTSEALLAAVNGDGGQPSTLTTLKPMLSKSRRFESTKAGWRRAPVPGAVRLMPKAERGDNGRATGTAASDGNGDDNTAPVVVREGDNETDNADTTDRGVVGAPPLRGQQTTVGDPQDNTFTSTFGDRFAAQQTDAWAALDTATAGRGLARARAGSETSS